VRPSEAAVIIPCPECNARFRLADEHMKPEGVTVRCTGCDHVFNAVGGETAPAEASAPVVASSAQQPAPVASAEGGVGVSLGLSMTPNLPTAPSPPAHAAGDAGISLGLSMKPNLPTAPAAGPPPGTAPPPSAGPAPTVAPRRATPPGAASGVAREAPVAIRPHALATRSSLGMVLFMVLLVFNGVCAFVLWKNRWRADLGRAGDMFRVALGVEGVAPPPASPPAGPRLALSEVRARTLENDQGRTILIIDGLASNQGSSAAERLRVDARLVEGPGRGSVVLRAEAPAAGRLNPEALRAVRTMDDVSRAHARLLENRGGDASLRPGESAAFTAVFPELPKDFDQAKGRYRFDARLGSYGSAGEDPPPDPPKTTESEGDDLEPVAAEDPFEGPPEEFFGPPQEG